MPSLSDGTIVLREYRKSDIPDIQKFTQDPEITQYLSDIFFKPHMLENTEDFLDFIKENTNDIYYVIADRRTDAYIGQIDIRIDWKGRIGTMGIVIGTPENLGKGIGPRAIQLLLEYAFNRLNLHKVELEVVDFNKRAISCYEKCGFVLEGRKREHVFRNGAYHDLRIMSILSDEFRRLKSSTEKEA